MILRILIYRISGAGQIFQEQETLFKQFKIRLSFVKNSQKKVIFF
jgi:hypothetical protein